MYDFNHDGKFDHRDMSFNYGMYKSTESGSKNHSNKKRSSKGNDYSGLIIWFVIMVVVAIIQNL